MSSNNEVKTLSSIQDNLTVYMDETQYLKLEKVIDKEVLEDYVNLEIKIRQFIDKHTLNICKNCKFKCCIYEYCIATINSPWNLFILRSKNIINDDIQKIVEPGEPFGLCENGCIFRIGRYKYCTSFICDTVIDCFTSIEAFAYKCISNILLFVNANFVNKKPLDEIYDINLFTNERFKRLRSRILLGDKLFKCSEFIFQNGEKVEDTVKKILFMKKYFPFLS